MKRVALFMSLALLLAGCAGLSRNVAGSWRCSAGEGTCAPLSSIDEAALARVQGGTAPPTPLSPAPSRMPLLAPFSDEAHPARSDERTLRIVFPAHVDAQGLYHEPAAVHAVVERPTWIPSRGGDARKTGVRELSEASVPPEGPPSPPAAVRLATPDEAVAMLARPIGPGPLSQARPVQSASDPVAGPEGAAEGFPPFPASVASQRTVVPAAARSPAAAGTLLPPAPAAPAPAPVAVLDRPRLSPGDDAAAGARLLNRQQLASLPARQPESVGVAPVAPMSGDQQ